MISAERLLSRLRDAFLAFMMVVLVSICVIFVAGMTYAMWSQATPFWRIVQAVVYTLSVSAAIAAFVIHPSKD